MITENLLTLKIHQLSKDQYKREFEDGHIDENAFYLTPDAGHMVVTIDGDKASHSFSEIKAHVEAGGTVMAQVNSSESEVCSLYLLNDLDNIKQIAVFTGVTYTEALCSLLINDDKAYSLSHTALATDGDISDSIKYVDGKIEEFVAAHNTAADAHADIRQQISQLSSEIVDINLEIPVRGTHYWTDADQEAIVQQVIAALGTPVFGRVDADNNIILTGNLVEGRYTVKYEKDDGTVVEVGNIVNSADILITPTWHKGYKLDSSTGAASVDSSNTYAYSDGIPFEAGTAIYISCTDRTAFKCFWYFYDDSGKFIGKIDWMTSTYTGGVDPMPETVITQVDGATNVRLRCQAVGGGLGILDRLEVVRRYV